MISNPGIPIDEDILRKMAIPKESQPILLQDSPTLATTPSVKETSFTPEAGLTMVTKPSVSNVPSLPTQADLGLKSIGMTGEGLTGYDISQDSYAQAALETLAEEQETGLAKFRESLRQMNNL